VLIGLLAALAVCWALPALARAADTVTLGPPLTSIGAAGGCLTDTTTAPADEPYFDCAYVDTTEPTDVVAQAPADGTITSWSVAYWNGTADLVIVKPTSSGDEIVAKSAEETEPCVPESLGMAGSICNPQTGVFTYATKLPIQAGDYIGIEGISAPGCGAVYINGGSCFMVGLAGGTSQYWNQAPALNTPTAFSNDGGGGLSGGIALDAVEAVAKTVSVSLSEAKITADGLATSTATASVTEAGKPVAGDSLTITSSDPGEKVGPVTDNGNGTYTATITASEDVEAATVTATDVSDPADPSGTAPLTQAAPTIAVKVSPRSIAADGKSTATATVTLTGVHGEPVPGQDVSISASGPALAGLVSDAGSGKYTATITATHSVGNSTITATDISVSPNVSGQAQLRVTAVKGKKGNGNKGRGKKKSKTGKGKKGKGKKKGKTGKGKKGKGKKKGKTGKGKKGKGKKG
jgi:Invasin, domain 3